MSEALDTLKKIGAQKIYEETHIPIKHIQAIIDEKFDGFTKVQFLGFVSILQREYEVDLSQLKSDGLKTFAIPEIMSDPEGVFMVPKKSKNFGLLYISLAVLLFGMFAYYNFNTSADVQVSPAIDDTVIINAQKNIEIEEISEVNESIDMNETNSTDEINATQEVVKVLELVPEKIEKSFKLTTKTKLWIGYVDIKTNIQQSKTFTGEFTLDPKKDWLLVLGHGFVDIIINEEVNAINSKEQVRFLYKDGELKKIDIQEFKKLNRGKSW